MYTYPVKLTNTTLKPGFKLLWRNVRWNCSQRCSSTNLSHISSQVPSHKPYFITTPIFYVNATPHIGHLYTLVLTDIFKRWQLLKGKTALLCTGTDEHGLKVQNAAAKANADVKLFCDRGAEIFRELARKAEITNDYFVRTTDKEHKDAVQYAWLLLQEKGLIYMQKHEGWYSVTDECFYPSSGVKSYLDPPTGKKIMVSIETGSEVDWSSEENYHFRLSAFRDKLLDFYKANPEWIVPEHRMRDVVRAVETGLEDLSISRPYNRLTWGIRVPGDETQNMYVWLDALMSYVTKSGYPWAPGRESAGGWPADCHVIGKDIVRFHCIYWPAFLMALGLPLPQKIFSHAHWTLGGSKMSKSTGIVVDPFYAIDRFGPDVIRFYLAHEGGIQDDSSYDNFRIIKLHNNLLQNQLGNLASRITRGRLWSVRGAVERAGSEVLERLEDGLGYKFWFKSLSTIASATNASFEAHDPRKAAIQLSEFIRQANYFLQISQPWSKVLGFGPENPGEDVDLIVYLGAEALRITGILLQPFMPNKARLLLDQLGVERQRRTFEYGKPGMDLHYGTPMVELGSSYKGVLFPPLSSQE